MPQYDLMNLVLTWASHGPGTQLDRVALVPPRGSPETGDCGLILCLNQDLLILFPIWACMALVTLVLTQASLGPGYSIPHLGLTFTRNRWSHSGPQTKLVTLVPPLNLTLTW